MEEEALWLKLAFTSRKECKNWKFIDEKRMSIAEKIFDIYEICIDMKYEEKPNYRKILKIIEEAVVENREIIAPDLEV